MSGLKEFFERKNVTLSLHRYGIDAMSAMAQGLFASLLIGTILSTIGKQCGIQFLVDAGSYASAVAGPAMACSIGTALKAPPLVLFSLIGVGQAANALGGAGRTSCGIFLRQSSPVNAESLCPKRRRWIFW